MSHLPLSHAALLHSAFYCFVPLEQPDAVAQWLREQCAALMGQIMVAHEGISGAVAGEATALAQFEHSLREHHKFHAIRFKHSRCTTPPFGRMKVQLKPELVQTGIAGLKATTQLSQQLTPDEWREAIAMHNTVVIDNRNRFEYRLGRFRGALDPLAHNFSDFPEFIQAHADEWKAQGKRIALYCTGGIRCEKTSDWVRSFGLDVVELQGGILNYFERMPDAALDFEGECFVFDNRIALNTRLEESGTRLEQVYEAEPDGAWRIARAMRLRESV